MAGSFERFGSDLVWSFTSYFQLLERSSINWQRQKYVESKPEGKVRLHRKTLTREMSDE